MDKSKFFEREIVLPDNNLSNREKTLIGFDNRYNRVKNLLNLLFNLSKLEDWCKKHHKKDLQFRQYINEQYPFAIFHGDVGTGKSVTAECMANRIVIDNNGDDAILYKLSNQVRGSGLVGESSTNLSKSLELVANSIGKSRQAILLIDEGDSLGATRSQIHSHHEDKVSVNTLIQGIDDLRQYDGRIVVFLCTNRISTIDAAIMRRAVIIEEFNRPTEEERRDMFKFDFDGLEFSNAQIEKLVKLTGSSKKNPEWTYSDIRTRLYPLALSKVFPDKQLHFDNLISAANELSASPKMEVL